MPVKASALWDFAQALRNGGLPPERVSVCLEQEDFELLKKSLDSAVGFSVIDDVLGINIGGLFFIARRNK